MPTNVIGSTFVVVGDTNRIGSLEHASYLKAVNTELEARQLRSVDPTENPDWLVVVDYSDCPPQRFSSSRPVFGQVGGGDYTEYGGTVWGSGGPAVYSGSSYTAPQYGIVGYRPTNEYWFGWRLRIQFYDGAAFRADRVVQRYDAKCVAVAKRSSRAEAIPIMVRETLRDFPGKTKHTEDKDISY